MLIKMILAFGIGLGLALLAYPIAIPFLHKIKFGQSIRELGPKSHMVKAGTPTMGGVVFIITSLVATLIVSPSSFASFDFLVVVLAFVGYAIIGFIDDYLIVVKKKNDGLKAKHKFLMQSVLAIVFYIVYQRLTNSLIIIPFTQIKIDLGWFYIVLVFFMFTGTTNGVNLADGLDGLCAGLSILAFIPYIYFCGRIGMNSVAILLCAVIGSLFGYLKFNIYPAKIFMGDAGALGLGGLLAAVAMVTKEEVALVLIGGVFVVEVLSVIIQIVSFQTRGKRVFKMAPLHHHFELSGWPEIKVVRVFWAAGAICCILGLIIGALM
ncbi:MAG: phospho-N-acetylmuramoyl-pentapeptide-transferase [Bacillota bacterium]|jgi:phospho-N-acetylmuramoyl-pentapeptide-transferase|nr:phospho-N-acetylmuramoyl-pentapeptide-transferase [Bacillota bacterium]NLL26848.1 phospho-N-acetylmuramoyl-pentapeptide-transferase [Erysipelotrichia bacterium]